MGKVTWRLKLRGTVQLSNSRRNPLKAPGGAEMAWHRHRHRPYVETQALRRMRSLLRLPRRAFIGGLRYGEGRLYTKNAGDALR